jgi:hypothetical protein
MSCIGQVALLRSHASTIKGTELLISTIKGTELLKPNAGRQARSDGHPVLLTLTTDFIVYR